MRPAPPEQPPTAAPARPTPHALSAAGAYAICFSAYIITGVFGYLLAGESTTGDILTRLPNRRHDDSNAADDDVRCPADVWACPVDVDIARFTIAITVSASYPMLQFVSRACLDDLLVTHGLVAAHERGIPTHRFLPETLFYVVVTTLIAMVEPDVATVMDYIGSTLALLQALRTTSPPRPLRPS